jgi:CDP-paratose 2-epimerase
MRIFERHARDITLIVHAAAQPSHDWAASAPHVDFAANALGTLNPSGGTVACAGRDLHLHVYKQGVRLPSQRTSARGPGSRLELAEDHRWYRGIDTEMPIDRCTHSLFGVSKVAADLLVQEYGRYFGMPTVCLRGGCLTGPQYAGARRTDSSPTS